MKKVLFKLYFILILALLSGCSNDIKTQGNTTNITPGRVIYHTQQGKLTNESSLDTVNVYTATLAESQIYADVYMETNINGEIIIYNLGNWERQVLRNGNLFITDLNGDKIDEIILFMEVTGNGGTLAQVFSVQADQIILLCDINDIDTSLKSVYHNDFLMQLENEAVGFSKTINISKEFGPDAFNAKSQYIGTAKVFLNPIHSSSIETANEGELPRIIAKRYVYLTNVLGELQTVFQYDPQTDTFILVGMDWGRGDNSVS